MINNVANANIENIARSEADVWENSPYYKQAEDWTWLFWDESRPFRKLFNQLDLTHLLELACGHGRHAEYVVGNFPDNIRSLTLMDILESNVSYCRELPILQDKATISVNNGTDYQPVGNASLTAIYCYDAMVHFDHRVVRSYLQDAFRVLLPGGKGLFHHSNFSSADLNKHFGQNPHARAYMSASLFKEYAEEIGLKVCEQIIIPWGNCEDIDCVSLVEKP